jgi:eukaryotic-like serine/threonine-protein kinase
MAGEQPLYPLAAASGVVPSAPPDSAPSSAPIRSDPFQAGEVIAGKYVIERVIGVGGVGIVLAAKHVELDETVAIKFLLPEVQTRSEIVRRFAREAKAAVRIKSEYAARVFDVGVLPGRGPYLVMEYLEGQNLADILAENGPMPVRRAVEYIMQACEALAVAHSSGIVHRDIKSENLFLARRDGTEVVKVLDFGISKAALTGSFFGGDGEIEKTQDLMGTPLYMSPEQIRSTRDVDQRTDVWSLGIVLFELITGRLPFEGETIPTVCAAVLESSPMPLASYMSDVPEGLQAVIDRCLQRDRERRFQNVAELAIALLPFGPSMARVFAERSSTIMRASGQTVGVTFRFHSSAAPPPDRTSSTTGVHIPAAPSTPTFPTMPAIPSDPAALSQITAEARRTRKFIIAAALLAVGLVAVGLAFVRHERSLASSAATTALRPVVVESDPPGARVEWDGKLVGETPATLHLPVGTQTLNLSKDGFTVEALSVTVAADASEKHSHITLKRTVSDRPAEPSATAPAAPPTPVRPAPAPAANPQVAFMAARAPLVRGNATGAKAGSSVPQPVGAVPVTTAAPPAPASPPANVNTSSTAASSATSTAKVHVVDDTKRVRILDDSGPSKVPLLK